MIFKQEKDKLVIKQQQSSLIEIQIMTNEGFKWQKVNSQVHPGHQSPPQSRSCVSSVQCSPPTLAAAGSVS